MRNHFKLTLGIILMAVSLAALTSCDMEYLSYRRAAGRFHYLWRLAGETDAFDVLFVMSPQPEDHDAIVALIRAHAFAWPVYVDGDGAMAEALPEALPENPRLHVFLMGADGKPAWLGSPVSDGMVDEGFLEKIVSLK